MNDAVRRIAIVCAWLLMALLVLATIGAFWFFIIVTGLSGGNGTMGPAAAGCFLLAIIEVIGMRLLFRQRGRYGQSESLP